MNIPMLSQIQDPIAKAAILELTQRMEQMEKRLQPTPAIGFHVKEGERHIGTAFSSVRHHIPD